MIRRLLPIILLLTLLVACGGPELPAATPQPSAKCPPPGTDVSIAQMMNPAFTADFVGCHVKAKALFWSPTALGIINNDPSVVAFQVTPPSTAAAQGTYYTVKITKAQSAPIFSFKQGDPVVLTGGMEAHAAMSMTVPFGAPTIFIADSIERGTP